MPELYPLLMAPHFDRRPWGARDLSPIYSQTAQPDEQPIGEAWLTADQCRVTNGPFGGATLGELCLRYGRTLVGSAAREAGRFPLLTKFLFPRDKLSVQVHPDDQAAQRLGQPCGKNECWYVVSAEPESRVALGLEPGTTRQQLRQAIDDHCAEELLHWVEVAAGDMIYVEAGTVHTMGSGPVLLEIQQNSHTTFRLYDYGRPRELHVQQGLEAMKETTKAGKVPRSQGDGFERLIHTDNFVVDRFVLEEEREFAPEAGKSASVLIAISGCGVLAEAAAGPFTFACGDAIVMPAGGRAFRLRPQWNLEFLRAQLP